MLSEDLNKLKKEINEMEKSVKKETDQQQLYNLSRKLQELYKSEYELECKLGD